MRKFQPKKVFLACFCLLLAGMTYAQTATVSWASAIGGIGSEEVHALASDNNGNVYVSGSFAGPITAGATTLTPVGFSDMFLAKLDNSGNVVWIKQGSSADASGTMDGFDLAVDNSGNVILAGTNTSFGSGGTIDGTTISGSGDIDIIVAKWDASGTLQNTASFGSGSIFSNEAYGVDVDGAGNIYLTGVFTETVDFGGNTLVSATAESTFLVKLSSTLTGVWAREIGDTTSASRGLGVAVDGSQVFLTGRFDFSVNFQGGGTTLGSGGNDVFVGAYSDAGAFAWSQTGGGAGADEGAAIAVDDVGDVFIAGYFSTSATFGSTLLSSSAPENGFFAKYSATGNLQFAEDPQSSGFNGTSRFMALTAGNTVTIGGTYADSLNFQNNGLGSPGGQPAGFSAEVANSNGADFWVLKGGVSINGAARSDIGELYFGGDFSGTTSVSSINLNSAGAEDGLAYETTSVMASVENIDQNLAKLSVYPNPFAADSRAVIDMKTSEEVNLVMVDINGRIVENVYNGFLTEGTHTIDLNAQHLGSGIYFLALTSGEEKVLLRVVKAN